jgi:ABC-type antimicrobial peptide transport system permease subunit
VWICLPYIRELLQIPVAMTFTLPVILFIVTCSVAVILLSGLYPAIVLSGYNAIDALKAKVQAQSKKGFNLRKGLIILQFVIAQALIIGTFVVLKQMHFFETATLGFDKTSVITIPIPNDSTGTSKINYLKESLLQQPQVKSVSFLYASPADDGNWYADFKFDHSLKNTDFGANMKWADADYLKTYNISLIAGRNYRIADTAGEVVVNEELIKRLGLKDPQDILNKELNFWDGEVIVKVVGVIKNFHTSSLEEPLSPIVVGNYKHMYGICNVKLGVTDSKETLSRIEKLWNTSFPSYVFEFRFLDQTIANFYRKERQLGELYKIFAGIAILLSCLGLYGLSSLLAVQKLKEVGIRKVLGATLTNILYLFSREFIILILLAFLIASPIAYYFLHEWLNDFTYRTNLSWWIFIAAGTIAMVVALVTISFHAVRAGLADPVKNLRTE